MEYKGIYYGDNKIQKFYEYGAHFKYSELYKKLEILKGIDEDDNKCLIRVKSNDNPHQILYINDKVKNILRSRNNNNNNLYYNNPNTQNLNSTKAVHIFKTRKKSANIPTNEINYEKVDSLQNIKTNNNIYNNNQINESIKNNYIANNSTRNRITNYIYQNKTTNNYINLLSQNSNNNNNNFHNNNSQKNNTKNNNQNLRSRNMNLNINYIKSVEDKLNKFITTREKNYINNDALLNKNQNQQNKKLSYISPHFMKKKLNINLSSSKYINKNLINNKLNPERINSGDNIFVKNYEFIRNYKFYK